MAKNKQVRPTEPDDISFALEKEFSPKEIKWRVGRLNRKDNGKTAYMLAYIDARLVHKRLDEVVGFENWQCKHIVYGPKTICHLGIRIKGDWVWKSDGAGDTNVEADKGAISDSLKRAAVHFGIGRYLYEFPDIWARVIDKNGYKVPDVEHCWEVYRQKKSIFS
tara:strand:- start:54 stop:545 length:492 start_codon:yes stop_codon:yes gene_type:complete